MPADEAGIVLLSTPIIQPFFMKTNFFIAAALALSCSLLAACGDSSTGANTVPIDSTNQTGAAPVQYSEGGSSVVDTNSAARDAYSRDTLGRRAGATLPDGHGTNSSNTSDARTTSGSANNGDADKDRKK